jgi:hypothetical protein
MKISEEVAATFHIYFIPALDVGGWSAFQQGENPRIYWTEGLAEPTTSTGRLQREVSLPQPELKLPTLSVSNAKFWLSILISYVFDKMTDILSGYFLHKLRLPLALVTTSINVLHAGGAIISHCNKQQEKCGDAGTLYLWYSPINMDPGLGMTANVMSSTFVHKHLYSLYVVYAIMTFCTVYLSKRYSSTVV